MSTTGDALLSPPLLRHALDQDDLALLRGRDERTFRQGDVDLVRDGGDEVLGHVGVGEADFREGGGASVGLE